MKYIVCVKQVPNTSGKVAVKEDGTMDRSKMATIINPDDLNAVEAALALRDRNPDAKVIVVSMGPPPAMGMLHELLAMGADEAVLVSGREFGGSDTFATSQILAGAISHIGLEKDDIVFCGRQAIDGDTAQVGPQIAEKLELPQVSYAADIQQEDGKLIVKRMLEDGYMTIEVETPCLLTCIKELNKPRYMSVRGVLEFDKKPISVFDFETLKDEPLIELDTIGLKGSPTNVYKSFSPPVKGEGVRVEATTDGIRGMVEPLLDGYMETEEEKMDCYRVIYQETRHWDPSAKRTIVMRVKETALENQHCKEIHPHENTDGNGHQKLCICQRFPAKIFAFFHSHFTPFAVAGTLRSCLCLIIFSNRLLTTGEPITTRIMITMALYAFTSVEETFMA